MTKRPGTFTQPIAVSLARWWLLRQYAERDRQEYLERYMGCDFCREITVAPIEGWNATCGVCGAGIPESSDPLAFADKPTTHDPGAWRTIHPTSNVVTMSSKYPAPPR